MSVFMSALSCTWHHFIRDQKAGDHHKHELVARVQGRDGSERLIWTFQDVLAPVVSEAL